MHFSPHFKESFLLCWKGVERRVEKAKGEWEKARSFGHLVGAWDQLLQCLHPLRYPLPPELQLQTNRGPIKVHIFISCYIESAYTKIGDGFAVKFQECDWQFKVKYCTIELGLGAAILELEEQEVKNSRHVGNNNTVIIWGRRERWWLSLHVRRCCGGLWPALFSPARAAAAGPPPEEEVAQALIRPWA